MFIICKQSKKQILWKLKKITIFLVFRFRFFVKNFMNTGPARHGKEVIKYGTQSYGGIANLSLNYK